MGGTQQTISENNKPVNKFIMESFKFFVIVLFLESVPHAKLLESVVPVSHTQNITLFLSCS